MDMDTLKANRIYTAFSQSERNAFTAIPLLPSQSLLLIAFSDLRVAPLTDWLPVVGREEQSGMWNAEMA